MKQESAPSSAEKVQALEAEVDRLKGIIIRMQRGLFGSTSERAPDLNSDQLFFNEIERDSTLLSPAEETETITYDRKKGRGKKKPYPEHLAREVVTIDLKDEEKICPHDGATLVEIGEDVTEKIKAVPAQFSVLVQIKKKYACPDCEAHVAEPKSNSILPGTTATPELLSYVMFSKFFQALPLYRMEELFKLNGIGLSRGTLARWLIQVKDELVPIYNLLEEKAFSSGYMAIDATHVQVLKEPGRSAQSKSFMWARGSPELGIALFDYDVSGGGKVAKRLMTDFKGALQADAHGAYGTLPKEGLTLLGCMMHARRRFHDAWLKAEKKPGLAHDALQMFQWVYEREAHYKKLGMTADARKEIRDKELRPSLAMMKEWMEEKIPKTLKTTELGNALRYFVREYDELTAFLSNGRFEIDNGWVERSIRKFAIGRNNWLFCDTVEGAHASSVLYSLVMTAKLNGKDPYKVMVEILTALPLAKTADDYERLTQLLLSPPNPLSCHKKEG